MYNMARLLCSKQESKDDKTDKQTGDQGRPDFDGFPHPLFEIPEDRSKSLIDG